MAGVKRDKKLDMCYVTRERILETAVGLFSTKGYLGASTREIARQAGVAEVTLFRHFSSKENLLEEVISRFSILPSLRSFIPQALEMPYEQALTALATMLLDTLIQLKDWVKIMHAELQRSPERLQKIYHGFLDEFFETFSSYFRELQKRGVVGMFDPEVAARVFHGIIFSYFNVEEVLQRKQYRSTESEPMIRQFMTLFAHGTLGPVTA